MRYRNPYILFKRTLKSGKKIWYYTYYDETGRRRQFSTGQKIKSLAQQVCHALYYSGAMYPNLPNFIPQLMNFQTSVLFQNGIAAPVSTSAQSNFAQNVTDKNQYPEKKVNSPT